MTRVVAVGGLLGVLLLAGGATNAFAQVFGTFNWQMQPYCNIVTLSLTTVGGVLRLDGSDDQCGAAKRASASGAAVFNPDGTVGLNFIIVTAPGGRPVAVSAGVSPASGQGTWTDSVGNSGTFAFFGSVAGLPPRPLPPSGIPPAVITNVEVANDAITGAKVANGSLTSVDVLDSPRAEFAGGAQVLQLTADQTVVRTVSLAVPAAGRVIVTGQALGVVPAGSAASALCALTTATTSDFSYRTGFGGNAAGAILLIPVATTQSFVVAAAGTLTVNFICQAVAGQPLLQSSSATAMYFPGS